MSPRETRALHSSLGTTGEVVRTTVSMRTAGEIPTQLDRSDAFQSGEPGTGRYSRWAPKGAAAIIDEVPPLALRMRKPDEPSINTISLSPKRSKSSTTSASFSSGSHTSTRQLRMYSGDSLVASSSSIECPNGQ